MAASSSISISVETYSWGTLRTIRKGSSYTVVIHPEDAKKIAGLYNGSVTFTDEQGITWTVSRLFDCLTFKSNRKSVSLHRDDLQLN